MKVSVLIACHGGIEWANLAWSRAYPSAFRQADECLVSYLRSGTIAQARNLAAMEASGEWLVFLDADDELEHGYVSALRDHLERYPEPTQLLVPRVSYIQAGYRQAPKYWHHGQADGLRSGNWLVIGTAVHRDVFDAAGGFREWPVYEDWDLWLRCQSRGAARPVKVPDMVYLAHVSAASRNKALPIEERNRIHREIHADNFPA